MVRGYVLQGLDCPNCANKIETAVRRADNVAQATGIENTFPHADSHKNFEKVVINSVFYFQLFGNSGS
jgi:copper chaperone CopZ